MFKIIPTAAQFFDEEENLGTEDLSERVVALLNEAATATRESHKVQNLRTVQELITQRNIALLDNFLDEVLSFKNDPSVDVKKFLISFMEIVCEKDLSLLPKVAANVQLMLKEENANIQKRSIRAATQLYRFCFKWISSSKSNLDFDDSKKNTWSYFQQIKDTIIALLDSYNDGVRTLVIKFMEMIIISQSFSDVHSSKDEICLDDIPTHVALILKLSTLEDQARKTLEKLILFHGTQHISSVNLMACTQSLVIIGKTRSEFIPRIIAAFEALHANLPPTLSKSQVSSVRKHLKCQLLLLCKHPASSNFGVQITTLLTDLGATHQELLKYLPHSSSGDAPRKRISTQGSCLPKKIPRSVIHGDEEDEDTENIELLMDCTDSAIDVTARDLTPLLTTVNVTDIVLVSMLRLPDILPANFQATYTPISVAGTEQQISHLSRLMATQMTASNVGKGVEELMKSVQRRRSSVKADPKMIETIGKNTSVSSAEGELSGSHQPLLIPSGSEALKMKNRQLSLSLTSRQLKKREVECLKLSTAKRLLRAGSTAHSKAKIKTLAGMALGGYSPDSPIRNFIFENIRSNHDLLIFWLFEEYRMATMNTESGLQPSSEKYSTCLQEILMDILIKVDTKEKDAILQKIFLEAPIITGNAIDVLQQYCQNELSVNHGLFVLRMLIEYRPLMRGEALDLLLRLTLNQMEEVRIQAVKQCLILCENSTSIKSMILAYATANLRVILTPSPPSSFHIGQQDSGFVWLEDDIKLCLTLVLGLLPSYPSLIHELASVYAEATSETKRIILWTLDQPIKAIGMECIDILNLLEEFPKGSETLLTRILHLLTEQNSPTQELVGRVRKLYHERVPDVRFLIPVLPGLNKKEVIAALPKLIKLNTNVVKEVFNRLLNCGDKGPLSASDLLIALHNIESAKCEMKTVIKATSLCFAEKSIYTQDVLAMVLQQLMEQSPLPTLLMRTAIQSLSLYPRLLGFIMNILQRLITKEIWTQKKVWEGFIKCCERAQPQSFNVIIQLPAEPLRELFEMAPSLKQPLIQHVNNLTQHQKSHISMEVFNVLFPEEKCTNTTNDAVMTDVD